MFGLSLVDLLLVDVAITGSQVDSFKQFGLMQQWPGRFSMQITTQQANQNADRRACSDPPRITMTTSRLLLLLNS
jgi:hypothetical protein